MSSESKPQQRRQTILEKVRVFLSQLLEPNEEIAFERTMAARPLEDDATFYQTHYASSGIPQEIPLKLRRLLAEQLGHPWERVQLTDQPGAYSYDFAEIAWEVEEEFCVKFSEDELRAMDGSFDSLVKGVAQKLGPQRTT